MSTTVFVSGATGFIAQHIVKQLIDSGYTVVGSVRSAEKGDALKKNLHSDKFSYEIVKDIAVPHAFDDALKKHPEVTVFLHTASPFHFNSKDIEKEMLDPAIKGTQNALQAIKDFGPQIKRVVVTSSMAAVSAPEATLPKTTVLTEESWNNSTWEEALASPVAAYRASKTFAERAAWDFVEKEKPQFAINTVNPTFVFGPQAFDSEVKDTLNTSAEVLNKVLQLGPNDEVPHLVGGFVDVRDVAKAHIRAFEIDETGIRLLLVNGRFTNQLFLDIINANIPELKGKLPVGTPNTHQPFFDNMNTVDTSKTLKRLGFAFIDVEPSTIDSIKQIVRAKSSKF